MSRFSPGFLHAANGNDQYTKILLHMDGANGGTSFPDVNAGGSAHSWSATGVTTSTASPKFGSASLAVPGGLSASAFVSTADSSDFNLGSQDFTIDFWVSTVVTTGQGLFIKGSGFAYSAIAISGSGGVRFLFVRSGVSNAFNNSTSIADGNYHHVAAIRTGNTLYVAVDGTLNAGSSFTGSVDFQAGVGFKVGCEQVTSPSLTGNIEEFRLSVGVARWTSNFTPPTLAYS